MLTEKLNWSKDFSEAVKIAPIEKEGFIALLFVSPDPYSIVAGRLPSDNVYAVEAQVFHRGKIIATSRLCGILTDKGSSDPYLDEAVVNQLDDALIEAKEKITEIEREDVFKPEEDQD